MYRKKIRRVENMFALCLTTTDLHGSTRLDGVDPQTFKPNLPLWRLVTSCHLPLQKLISHLHEAPLHPVHESLHVRKGGVVAQRHSHHSRWSSVQQVHAITTPLSRLPFQVFSVFEDLSFISENYLFF